ncbi:hypothetical protein GCM10027615_44390 [Plantactinospora veratri]
MNLPVWVWAVTIVGFLAMIAFDFYLVARNPREPAFRECVAWVSFYVLAAIAFGFVVMGTAGVSYGGQFFAGWLTEYSLSVDNLFVFIIIMSRFAVPVRYRQKVLLIGIVLALLMRGIFIAAGAQAVARFDWLFYLFGAFLIYTAIKLVGPQQEDEFSENLALRTAKRILPTTESYRGASVFVRVNGRRMVTPMLIVMIAIGTTDLLFALDSIPAIFGLTQEPYLVFTANTFALMACGSSTSCSVACSTGWCTSARAWRSSWPSSASSSCWRRRTTTGSPGHRRCRSPSRSGSSSVRCWSPPWRAWRSPGGTSRDGCPPPRRGWGPRPPMPATP